MSDTTIRIDQRQLAAIEDAALELFGTDAVTRRAVIERLLADHPEVSYDGQAN